MADATDKATTGAPKRQVAITSTTRTARLVYIFSDAPGPLPSVYGTILSGGRG